MADNDDKIEVRHPPTPGCYAAADYFIDFETLDSVSNGFKQSLENFPSEMDAVAAVARHINNATRASELLEVCKLARSELVKMLPPGASFDTQDVNILLLVSVTTALGAVIARVEGKAHDNTRPSAPCS